MPFDNMFKPGYWGAIVGSDSKNNFTIGTSGVGKVGHRFRASESSAITYIRWPQRWGAVYSAGDGGIIRITLQSDNNGVPSGTVLSTVPDYYPGNAGDNSKFLNFAFSNPYTVTKGTVYHIVAENVHSSPTSNYISWNDIFHYNTAQHPVGLSDDYKVMFSAGGWDVAQSDRNIGIMDITYSNGAHDGQGYIHTMIDQPATINGTTSMVRQTLNPSVSRTVTGFGLRMVRVSGTGSLQVRLETSGGTNLETVAIPYTSFKQDEIVNDASDGMGGWWVSAAFTGQHTLTAGQTYYLRLYTDSSTTYRLAPNREGWDSGDAGGSGHATGFRSFTFREGQGEETTNSGGSWAMIYPWSPVDLQFYFTTTELGTVEPTAPTGTLLVVGNTGSPTTGDAAVRTRLEGLGHTVTYQSAASTQPDLSGVDLVVISESCSSIDLGQKYADFTGPIFSLEAFWWDNAGWTTSDPVAATGTHYNIVAHDLTAGITPGAWEMFTASTNTPHTGNTHGENAQVAAHYGSTVTNATLFAYEAGVIQANFEVTPARRVGFAVFDPATTTLTATGWTIFDNSVNWLMEAPPASGVLVVVADKAALTSADTTLINRLQTLGHTVTTRSDEEDDSVATEYELVVITESCSSSAIAAKYKTSAVPVIHHEFAAWDDMGLITTTAGSLATQTDMVITSSAHAIRGSVPAGQQTIYTTAVQIDHSINAHGAQATMIAHAVGDATRYTIFAYEAGATLADGTTAADKRLAFSMQDPGAPEALNANGLALFDNAVAWALGGVSVTIGTGSFTANAEIIVTTVPVWTSPANGAVISLTTSLAFMSPPSASVQHFQLEVDTEDTFNSSNYALFDSFEGQGDWQYHNGTEWVTLTTAGLPVEHAGKEVRLSLTFPLGGTWYRRVRAGE